MSTVSGFGTRFYGWQHFPDGTSTATRWVAFFYLPVIPLERMKLRVLTDFASEKFLPKAPSAAAKAQVFPLFKQGMVSREDRYEVLEQLPFSDSEILATYFRTFILMPLAMLWPIILVVTFFSAAKSRGWADEMWAIWVGFLLFCGALGNLLAVAIWAIRRTRGTGGLSPAPVSAKPRT